MKKGRGIRRAFSLALAVLLLGGCGGTKAETKEDKLLDSDKPVTITVWTYYNGQQLTAFNQMVEEFNSTEGAEQGIVVESYSHGSVVDLEANVLAAARGKAGAGEIPNIFSAYVDNAYALDQMGKLADLSPYLTEEELDIYVDSYIEEGRFAGDGSIKIFPTAKSTEVFMLNDTAWQYFAEATGASYEDFSTIEGLVSTAQAYYEWTDSLTPDVPNDGQTFFGRDAMANYMLIGSMQQGTEIFQVRDGRMVLNFDRETVRRLWDNFYVPYIKGYFTASGRFRSDDVKTGNIIALVGSSSSATYFPSQVVLSDTESYDIECKVFPAPQFRNSDGYAVQQGAGMVVTEGKEEEIYASVQFLKWFTQSERNVVFSTGSGYMPVTKEANDMEFIQSHAGEISPLVESVLRESVGTINQNKLYTPKAFPKGTDAREVLDRSMSDQAKEDRAQVEEALSQGLSLEEAVAPFLEEEHFDKWYTQTQNKLKSLGG